MSLWRRIVRTTAQRDIFGRINVKVGIYTIHQIFEMIKAVRCSLQPHSIASL